MKKSAQRFCNLLAVLFFLSQVSCSTKHQEQAFDRVLATNATETQRESALFFRSAFLSDSANHRDSMLPSGATLVSLNPTNPEIPPVIFDTTTGSLTPITGSNEKLDGIRIVHVLELGAFAGKFAAAKALVRDGSKECECWGYVDTNGHWIIAPRYDNAEVPVNRWAKVSKGTDAASAIRQILDLEAKTSVPLPHGRAPRNDALTPTGSNVFFAMNREANNDGNGFSFYLISAATGKLIELPGAPSYSQAGNNQLVFLESGSFFDPDTGKVLARPDSEYMPRGLLPGIFEFKMQIGNRPSIDIWDLGRKATIAKDLRAAEKLTSQVFVACDQGDNLWPTVRRGFEDPRPMMGESKLRCGLMDAKGQWRVTPKYQHFHLLDNHQVLLRNRDEWCLFDINANASPNCGSQMPVSALGTGGLWMDVNTLTDATGPDANWLYGYRNALGELTVPFQFERAKPFVGKIAEVMRFGVPGLINTSGTWLTPEPPSHIVPLILESNVRANGSPCESCYGLINRKGGWVWQAVFSEALPGPAVGQFWVRGNGDSDYLQVDEKGRVLKRAGWNKDLLPDIPHNDPVLVPDEVVATRINGKWGLTDIDGNWLLPAQFKDGEIMSDTRAVVQTDEGWGMIATSGKWIVNARFASFEILNQELAMGCDQKHTLCQIFNAAGIESGIKQELAAALPFDEAGFAAAQVKDTQLWGYLNRQGQWAIEPSFTKVYNFSGSFALAQNSPQAVPQTVQSQLSAYLIKSVSVWPSAQIALISVLPKSILGEAQKKDWAYVQDSLRKSTRIGLMDTEGRWMIPKMAVWKALH